MSGLTYWIIGTIAGLIGVVGLFVASDATSGSVTYWIGLVVFAVAVGFEFGLIRRWFDRQIPADRSPLVEAD